MSDSDHDDPAAGAARFFDRVAARYDRSFAPDAAATDRDLAALLVGVAPGGVALDLGCGTGRAWPSLLAAGLRPIGLDASLPMLRQAARRSSAAGVLQVRADLYAGLPLGDATIDVVLALHAVLAHPPGDPFAAWARVGAELARVGRPGALVAIDLPEPAWARQALRALGGDRYLHREGELDVVAVVPEPAAVVAALGLPLACVAAPTGARALGRLGARSR